MKELALGFTLLEVLISTVILALILFAFNATQLTALRQVKSVYFYSVATDQLAVMNARLKLLQYQPPSSSLLQEWNQQNYSLLPQGRGEVHEHELVIYWGENQEKCFTMSSGVSGCLRLIF